MKDLNRLSGTLGASSAWSGPGVPLCHRIVASLMGTSANSLSSQPAPFVVFGTSRWSDPWLTEQNLAVALAASHPLLYVEPAGISWRRRTEEGVARLRVVQRDGRHIFIFRPVVFPRRSREIAAHISAPLLRAQVRAVVRRLGFVDPVVLSGDARPGIVGSAGERLSCYLVKDWVIDDPDLLGRSASALRRERDAMCAAADVVLAISPSLQASLAEHGIRSEVLRHGFHTDLAALYGGPRPDEYVGLGRPIIAFAGRIDGRLDVSKLRAVAKRFPDATVVLIGPESPRISADTLATLDAEANVVRIGTRSREALPAYLANADCLLIPYCDSSWSRHGSPLKLWDYLYAGPPIVASGYTILRDYPDLVHFAETEEAFVEATARVLEEPGSAAARRAFALANSWDARATELERLLERAAPEAMLGVRSNS